jgi:hypothetical protein
MATERTLSGNGHADEPLGPDLSSLLENGSNGKDDAPKEPVKVPRSFKVQ